MAAAAAVSGANPAGNDRRDILRPDRLIGPGLFFGITGPLGMGRFDCRPERFVVEAPIVIQLEARGHFAGVLNV